MSPQQEQEQQQQEDEIWDQFLVQKSLSYL